MSTVARLVALVSIGVLTALVAASPASATPVLQQDFEGGLGSWTTSGFWHVQDNPQNVSVKPEIFPGMVTLPSGQLPPAFSGTRAAWFGEESSGTFCGPAWSVNQTPKGGCTSNAVSYTGSLTSPAFNLTGALSAILRFRAWWEIEGVNANSYDIMEVEYSTDGGSAWTKVGKLNPANNPASKHDESYSNNGLLAEPGWKNYIVDLSAAIGSPSVRVRFTFDTDDNLYNGFRGWLVDDVAVSTPFDAPAAVLTDVATCSGLKPAPIWTAHGSNFVQDSQVYIDGVHATNATMPAPDRVELQAGNAGQHTIKLVAPSGAQSNTLQFTAGNCAESGKHPSKVQVFCNYIVASETDTCTATVADATGAGRIPTGTVKFTSANGGAFLYGDSCTLKKAELSTVSSCTIEGFKPEKSKPIAVSGSYPGDDGLLPSGGATQFLMAAPGTGAYLETIKPFQGFGAPNGPQNPTVTVTVKNPVAGTNVNGNASLSTNGSVCSSGMGGSGASSALASATSLLPAVAPTSVVAVVSAKAKAKGKAKGEGKAKGKRKAKRLTVPGLKYKKPKVKKINAVVVTKTKRNAKAGEVKLQLKFNNRKLKKMFGKKKKLTLVVRVTLDFKKGQPAVIYRAVKLKRSKGGAFKVVKQKGASKPKAKKTAAIAARGRAIAQPAQSGATHRWVGGNDCNQLAVAAQFDQGDNQAPFVGFQWQGQMLCIDGSTVPFNYAPPSGMRGTITGANSVTFSFAEFTNPGYTLSGTLFSGSAAASGKIGGQFPNGASCQAIAPTVLTQVQ
jgi:hypothetical protein